MRSKHSGLKNPGVIETQIEGLLDVSPLANRLEAAIYIYLTDHNLVKGQDAAVEYAQAMASFLITYVHIDADRK